MDNETKLKIGFFDYPILFLRFLYTFVILGRHGFFSLILKLDFWPKKIKLLIKVLIFFTEKKSIRNLEKNFPQTLVKLGPGFIKLGQALSTRPDIFGLKITRKLVYLQDKLDPFPSEIAIKIIESDFESKLNQIFSNFDRKAIATASVAQVYQGTLLSGEKVAIKVLRPNIEKLLFKDFKFFFWFSKVTEFFYPKIKRFKFPEMVKSFADSSINEVDLKLEASSANELHENFLNFNLFKVPKVFWKFTSKNVLTLEYIEGVRIDKIKDMNPNKISIKKITKLASEVFFLQVFRDGFFHADLHPGNIFVDKKGVLVAIDFGIMGRLKNKDRKFLAELLINLLDKNFSAVTKLHYDYDMLGPNVPHDLLTHEIRAISTPIIDKPIGQISLATLMGEILSLSNKFDIKIQPRFALLQKTMVMAEGIARQLNPNANMWKLTKPLVEKWIKENYDPFNLIQDWLQNNKKAFNEIPEFFHKLNKIVEKILKKL